MTTVQREFGVDPTEGDLGVEIEVEGDNLPRMLAGWNVTHDGSLRNYHGMALEYVFRRPYNLDVAERLLQEFGERMQQDGTTVANSPRCGVHVHVNVQELTITQLYNFFALYLTFEDLLIKFCGETREGNLFCLRAKDAEYLTYILEAAARSGRIARHFGSNELRYAAMNVCSLGRYGSLEFRAMRGTVDPSVIGLWCRLLLSLREMAKRFDNPYSIAVQMSAGGEAALLLETFGEEGRFLMQYEGWTDLMREGVRRTQGFSHAGDWETLSRRPSRVIGGVEVEEGFEDDFPPVDV